MEIPKDNVAFKFKDGYAFSNALHNYIIYPKEHGVFKESKLNEALISKPKFFLDFEGFNFKDYKIIDLSGELKLKVEDVPKKSYIKVKLNSGEIEIGNHIIKKKEVSLFGELINREVTVSLSSEVISKFLSLFKNKRLTIYYCEPWFFIDSEKIEMYFGKSIEGAVASKPSIIKEDKAEDVVFDPYKDLDYLLEKIRKDGIVHT